MRSSLYLQKSKILLSNNKMKCLVSIFYVHIIPFFDFLFKFPSTLFFLSISLSQSLFPPSPSSPLFPFNHWKCPTREPN